MAERISALQRRILLVLAALAERRPGPVATRDIERLLEQGGDAPVYGPNLRASCRRLAEAGFLRILRARNLQLAVELTEAGRTSAGPILKAEQEEAERQRREAEVRVIAGQLPPASQEEISVNLNGQKYMATGAAFVVRLSGSTCLQLEIQSGVRKILDGDALQVADWYRACQDAGLPVRVQVNPDTQEGTQA